MASYESNEGFTRFLDVAANHRLLTAQEEVTLARKWRNEGDNEARHVLFMHNVRLVVSIARHFLNRGLPFEDLVQAGLVGLDRATRKFDPEKGYKASTYASWWIRQAVQRAVASESKTIRVPNQVSTRRLQVDAYLRDNPEATLEQVALKLQCTVPQVIRAQEIAEVVSSLDQEYKSDDMFSLGDTLPDTYASDPYDVVTNSEHVVGDALEHLTLLERDVVTLRYGIGNVREHTLQEIAVLLELPLKEIQVVQRDAFAKLRDELTEL